MRRSAFAGTLVLPLVLALGGCGDQEADQRKAFTTFLQTRIIDKPGIHVPQPSEAERRSFGRYADHYAVITGFHKVMNESVSPQLTAAMAKGAIRSLGDLITRHGDLQAARSTIDAMAAALGSDLTQADAAHRKLEQPADVKAVYDKAYDRLVTATAATFSGIVPVADQVFTQALDLGDYLQQHHVTVNGSMLQVSEAATRSAINAKLQRLQASQQAAQAAETRFRTFVYGAGDGR